MSRTGENTKGYLGGYIFLEQYKTRQASSPSPSPQPEPKPAACNLSPGGQVFLGPFWAQGNFQNDHVVDVRKFLKYAARVAASVFFFFSFSSFFFLFFSFSRNFLEIPRTPPKILEILVLFVPQTRELFRRELEHVSRPDGGGCESSRTLAPSLFLFRCFLFGRAISVFSERFFNRLRPEKKNFGKFCDFLSKISKKFSTF